MDKTILIVDDMEINRAILAEGFTDTYNILEAEDGEQALEMINKHSDIAAVLLDLLMPKMTGIEVLRELSRTGKINHIPVFIITAADNEDTLTEAYNLGAVDVISKPFIMNFIKSRITNIVELYSHRNELVEVVNEQIEKLNKVNQSMIETLATLIEFRDCESGEHVKRICGLTRILLTYISDNYPEYYIDKHEIEKIVNASILHDVGKIAIPDKILNKPGRLTKEEFEIMKQHTVKGSEMLMHIPAIMDEDTFSYTYDICRHHHERWDGRGYPDGLAGDDITIWAQIVALADVYDALTSPRCYKSAYPHDVALNMIYNGECGTFNPKVLEALRANEENVKNEHELGLFS